MSIAIGIGVGLLAGLLAGMLGVGGGVILIPGMIFLMGVEQQHTAQGVSLVVITLMALAGTITHYRQENVRLRVALWIAPAAVLFAFIGGMVADMIDASVLRQIFGAVLVITGIVTVSGWWRRG
ncbi:MAG: TSUP family transporter [Dehalococcoidia bacterium]